MGKTTEKIIINQREYEIDEKSQYKNIKKILNMYSETPLRQEEHVRLLNKLQKYDLQKIGEDELEEILPLVLRNVNNHTDEKNKEEKTTKNHDCGKCGKKGKKKITLTRHLKTSEKCKK